MHQDQRVPTPAMADSITSTMTRAGCCAGRRTQDGELAGSRKA
jgi:hypothetical protein